MLRTFPFSLSEESKTWLNELNKGTITSWNEMRDAFISRYFYPSKFKRLLNEIHSFHQLAHETLVDAWFQIKEMLRICYRHGLTKGTIIQIFYSGLNDPTQGILDVGGIFLYNTLNEAFQILEDKVLLKLYFSGLRNHQAIIQNLERKFEFLLPTETLPRTINTKLRHEIVYNIPLIQNDNDKGDVKFIEEEETEPNPTMPNPNLIMSNSSTVSPFLKDCTVHIPYTQEKVFEHDEISNHVGDKINIICWHWK
ncbi:reverse transcriptase domain-containing protein [Tanacetum coccineum]